MNLTNFTEFPPPTPEPEPPPKKPREPKDIGPHLRAFRLYHRYTVSEMAEICGVNRSTWGYYEGGRFRVKEEKLQKVAEHFGVSVMEIKTWPVTNIDGHGRPRISKKTTLHIQSQAGKDITVDEVIKLLPDGVEDVYVKAEEGRAYWVKGDTAGYVELF